MVQGYERRAETQPIQNQDAPQVHRPLSGVVRPTTPNMDYISKSADQLDRLLGGASKLVTGYLQKKQEEWKLEGQLAYASGKAEEAVREEGNRYNIAGFMAMKAKTASNVFMQDIGKEIDDFDHQLTPSDFAKKTAEKFKGMVDTVSGLDSETARLFGGLAEDMIPRLAAKHAAAHSAWKEQETYNSAFDMWTSTAASIDPEDTDAIKSLSGLMSEDATGLSKEKNSELIAAALEFDEGEGRNVIRKALNIPENELSEIYTDDSSSVLPKGLVSAVLKQESNNRDFDKNGKPIVSPKGAMYAMQVMPGTSADPGYGVTPARDNTPAEINRVGRDYLTMLYKKYQGNVEHTLMAYNWGPGAMDNWLKSGQKTDVPDETKQYVSNIMGSIGKFASEKSATLQSLAARGFSPDQIQRVRSALDKAETKRSQEFNEGRVLAERGLEQTLSADGNFEAALKRAQEIREKYGLSDNWMNSMANRLSTIADKYAAEEVKNKEIVAALGSNRLNSLATADQNKALDLARKRAEKSFSGVDAEARVDEYVLDIALRNNIVDPVAKRKISAGLSGDFTDRDGGVRQDALDAYSKWVSIYKTAGSTVADQYAGDNKTLLYDVLSLDSGSPDNALLAAQRLRTQKSNGVTAKPINEKKSAQAIKDFISDKLELGLLPDGFDFWSKNALAREYKNMVTTGEYMAGARVELDMTDEEWKRAGNNPGLLSKVVAKANNLRVMDPNRPQDSLIKQAVDDTMKNAEIINGDVIFGSPAKSIREAMGIKHLEYPNLVHAAVNLYVLENAKRHLGEFPNTKSLTELSADYLTNEVNKLSNFTTMYQPDTETFVITMYDQKTWTERLANLDFAFWEDNYMKPVGVPMVVPAKLIGKRAEAIASKM